MRGRHAARAIMSDTRYTIQPMIPRKRNQKRGRPHDTDSLIHLYMAATPLAGNRSSANR